MEAVVDTISGGGLFERRTALLAVPPEDMSTNTPSTSGGGALGVQQLELEVCRPASVSISGGGVLGVELEVCRPAGDILLVGVLGGVIIPVRHPGVSKACPKL